MLPIFPGRKSGLFVLIICLLSISGQAQSVPPQDAVLSGYTYPYPVHYFSLNIQGQPLKMAYMDVQPRQPNGKGRFIGVLLEFLK